MVYLKFPKLCSKSANAFYRLLVSEELCMGLRRITIDYIGK